MSSILQVFKKRIMNSWQRLIKNDWITIIRLTVISILLLILISSCKKLVETPPPSDYVTGANAYITDATAIAVLNSIYVAMNQTGGGQPVQGNNGIAVMTGLSADELKLYNGVTNFTYLGYYQNALSQNLNGAILGHEYWAPLYNYVFKCNAAIEGLQTSTSLSPNIKKQLLGEAMFLRAFFYFYLVNLFGDLPLVLNTDPEVNTLLPRSSISEVYKQIIADLEDAAEKLSDNYLNETLLTKTSERVRPTKWAAKALLARANLYTGDYLNAETNATTVIGQTTLYGVLSKLNDVFLKNSLEAIWQLQPIVIEYNTAEARTLVIPQQGPNTTANPVFLSDTLLKSFEVGDKRSVFGNWIDTTIYRVTSTVNNTVAFPNKYKLFLRDTTIKSTTGTANMKEYFMVLRLAEQYLIRAEARSQLGNINGAKSDLNVIRARAGLEPTLANDKNALLKAILKERQVELFAEWGHRWLDLKRTSMVDEVMMGITPLKANGAPWQSYQQWYPLPLVSDLQKAPNLEQNIGY
jgi:starch-binding outer membrane protein, SusD/RagB family